MSQDFRNCIRGGTPEAVSLWHRVCDDMDREEREWIESLRAQGVKAAHPDDGWVDRERNAVTFTYPQFNDGAGVGDLIALGWPQHMHKQPQHRIVRLTGSYERGVFMSQRYWAFEAVDGVADSQNVSPRKE